MSGKYSQNKEKILFIIGVAFCLFIFSLTLIRAATTAITYDEATTYLLYCRENLLEKETLWWFYAGNGAIANNHWLNTFLIWITEKITNIQYSEFMIRLPILSLYAVYLIAACRALKKGLISFPMLIFLAGNYYLSEFYGLARGYGMANTFVFLFCLSYLQWKNSNFDRMRYLNFAMIWAILATLSHTLVLLLYPAVGLVCLYRIITTKKLSKFLKNCGPVFLALIATAVLMTIYHFNVTAEGKPLYAGGINFFDNIVKGYAEMFVSGESLISIISIAFSVLLCLGILKVNLGMKELDFGLMMIIFLLTNVIMQQITHKGYIATRELLPFFAFLVLASAEIFKSMYQSFIPERHNSIRIIQITANTFLCLACVCIFISKIDLTKTKDWKNDYRFRTYAYGDAITEVSYGGWSHPCIEFYQDKIEATTQEYYSYLR